MDTRLWIVLVHTVLAIGTGTGCAKPATPVAPAEPPVVRAAAGPSVRTKRALCDGAPCTVTVAIAGNHGISSEEIFAEMRVVADADFSLDVLQRDVLVLYAIYYDRGYLTINVPAPTVTWSRDRSAVQIDLSIEEGIRYRISRLDAYEDREGLRCPPMGGWSSPIRPGELFSRRAIASELTRLRRTYRDQGYARVEAEPKPSLDPDRGEVEVDVPVKRGAVHAFGRIRIQGNSRANETDLKRRIEAIEGARFSETALERSKASLLAAGLFDRVEVRTVQGREPTLVDVIFEVSERSGAPSSKLGGEQPAGGEREGVRPIPPARTIDDARDTGRCRPIPAPNEVRVAHILVMHAGSEHKPAHVTRSRDAARRRAGEALQKIRSGASFEEMVRQYSDEPGAAPRQGDVGTFGRGVMAQAFSNAAFGLRVGEVSEIVETKFGFHIIKRTE